MKPVSELIGTKNATRFIAFLFSLCTLFAVQLAQATQADGLNGRLIVGYQGWFGCPGDDGKNTGWQHWFMAPPKQATVPDPHAFAVDMIPSVRDFDKKDLSDTGLKSPGGEHIYLYSTQNPTVVNKHFSWMRDNNIDGVALQRFIGGIADPAIKTRHDHLVRNVMAAAQQSGRVFFITYDITNANPGNVINDVRKDWIHLVNDLKITDNPQYLHVQGKPVLQIWGFGFKDRPGNSGDVLNLLNDLKSGNQGLKAAYMIGGVPAHWRTLDKDSSSDAGWADVYHTYDVLSPWTVGRYSDARSIDDYVNQVMKPDLADAKKHGIGYLPVIYAGYSF